MRERYALLKHLSERPADSVQVVLEQLRQDDAREEERYACQGRRRARAASSKAGSSCSFWARRWALFLYYLVPGDALWMIGLMPILIGVVLGASRPCSSDRR